MKVLERSIRFVTKRVFAAGTAIAFAACGGDGFALSEATHGAQDDQAHAPLDLEKEHFESLFGNAFYEYAHSQLSGDAGTNPYLRFLEHLRGNIRHDNGYVPGAPITAAEVYISPRREGLNAAPTDRIRAMFRLMTWFIDHKPDVLQVQVLLWWLEKRERGSARALEAELGIWGSVLTELPGKFFDIATNVELEKTRHCDRKQRQISNDRYLQVAPLSISRIQNEFVNPERAHILTILDLLRKARDKEVITSAAEKEADRLALELGVDGMNDPGAALHILETTVEVIRQRQNAQNPLPQQVMSRLFDKLFSTIYSRAPLWLNQTVYDKLDARLATVINMEESTWQQSQKSIVGSMNLWFVAAFIPKQKENPVALRLDKGEGYLLYRRARDLELVWAALGSVLSTAPGPRTIESTDPALDRARHHLETFMSSIELAKKYLFDQ